MIRPAPVLFVVALAGCASIDRGSAPQWSGKSARNMDQTTSCVIKALDAKMKTSNPLGKSFTHHATIVEPGKVYEVLPQQTIQVAGELYSVRLTAQGGSTQVDLYSFPTWTDQMRPAVAACAS